VLDLSELGFTDCAGLGAMVWAHKHLAEQGRELVLTGIQPLTRRLLGLTGLDTLARQHPEDPGQPGQEPIPAARRHERNRAPPDSGTSRWRTFPHAQWSRSGNTWPGSLRTCSERTLLPSPRSATPAAAR
jgi:hypothetical protein